MKERGLLCRSRAAVTASARCPGVILRAVWKTVSSRSIKNSGRSGLISGTGVLQYDSFSEMGQKRRIQRFRSLIEDISMKYFAI